MQWGGPPRSGQAVHNKLKKKLLHFSFLFF